MYFPMVILLAVTTVTTSTSSSNPSTVGGASNLYIGGTKLEAQPTKIPKFIIGGGMYRDRFPTKERAIENCKLSNVCKGQQKNCRSIGYVLNQIRCDQLAKSGGGQSETTMLCDESAACKDDPTTKCMFTYECETESPTYDSDPNWNNNMRFRGTRGRSDGLLTGTVVSDPKQLHTAGDILAEHNAFPHDEAVE